MKRQTVPLSGMKVGADTRPTIAAITASPPRRSAGPTYPSRAVLQDPVKLFAKKLARELKAGGMDPIRGITRLIAFNPQAQVINFVARQFLVAQQRALLIQDWRSFQAENAGLGIYKATALYVRLLESRGVTVSRASLYEFARRADRSGLMGLIPEYHGGRPAHLPAVDLSIIRRLLRDTSSPSYGLYLWARGLATLPGKPITRTQFPLVVNDLMGAKRSARRRAPRRGQATSADKLAAIGTTTKKTA